MSGECVSVSCERVSGVCVCGEVTLYLEVIKGESEMKYLCKLLRNSLRRTKFISHPSLSHIHVRAHTLSLYLSHICTYVKAHTHIIYIHTLSLSLIRNLLLFQVLQGGHTRTTQHSEEVAQSSLQFQSKLIEFPQ